MATPIHNGQRVTSTSPLWFGHTGASMNPTLCDRDLLEVVRHPGERSRCGDVVVFPNPSREGFIVHRVVAVTPQGLLTRGDNNRGVDPWCTKPQALQGRVVGAWRGSRRRPIHGGRRGRLDAVLVRLRHSSDRLPWQPLRWAYHAFARSGLAQRVLPASWQQRWRLRIAYFEGQSRYPMSLQLGGRTIGRFDGLTGNWLIRGPFRLLIDASKLPSARLPERRRP
jgi:hypothetical protein